MQIIPISQVEFVKQLYPRLKEDDATIAQYRAAIDQLPPIAIAKGRVLVDGFHRWRAHIAEGKETIQAIDLGDLTDAEIFRESAYRNAKHGLQLSTKDKQSVADRLWRSLVIRDEESDDRVPFLANILSVTERTIREWTKDARKEEKEEKKQQAWDLWLDCRTEQAIADEVGVAQKTVSNWLSNFGESSEFTKPPASLQHFDDWYFEKIDQTAGRDIFGRCAGQIVENLLWLYTEPGDIVFDPFAGGGTTIDVAKRMGRRVWASDLIPFTPTLPIHQHNILDGWPENGPKKTDFIFLDPPYWKQAAGKYSEDPDDLSNMTLDDFRAAWDTIVAECIEHLTAGGHMAFIVSPTIDGNDSIDHAFEMQTACREAGWLHVRRIIARWNHSIQATGQEVEWAIANKQLLRGYQDIVVMRKA